MSLSGIGMTSQRTRLRMVERLRQQGIRDEVVLNAMAQVPRHIFIEEALASRAYDDVSLPIGLGQTISQPYIVARMSELARAGQSLNRVLEIGTGCGYQASVLALISKELFSIERIAALQTKAREHVRSQKISNIRFKLADGHHGLPEAAPFDAIVMTAAATHVPPALTEQLKPGGRLILPLGTHEQILTLIERTPQGLQQTRLEPVRFVPLLPGLA
jgi:protein-L-isoaspartate(D-aspartate) O-methyltransferase